MSSGCSTGCPTHHLPNADSTFSRAHLSLLEWSDVQTGKAMDINLYTVELYQRGGSGVPTHDIGKEEVGSKVESWPLVDSSSFEALLSMYNDASTMAATPDVSASGTGYNPATQRSGAVFSHALGVSGSCLRGSGGVHSRWPALVQRRQQCIIDAITDDTQALALWHGKSQLLSSSRRRRPWALGIPARLIAGRLCDAVGGTMATPRWSHASVPYGLAPQ